MVQACDTDTVPVSIFFFLKRAERKTRSKPCCSSFVKIPLTAILRTALNDGTSTKERKAVHF